LKNIVISNTVSYIGLNCFKGCISLQGIGIPDVLGSSIDIGNNCFESCTGLNIVVFFNPNKTTLGADLFLNCTQKIKVTFYKTSAYPSLPQNFQVVFPAEPNPNFEYTYISP